jgi:predicted PurR-regulated permease PerM
VTLDRRYALGGLFALLALLATFVLADVLATVFFAVTIAYALSPVRRRLVRRGLSDKIASTAVTSLAFVALGALLLPVGFVVYRRRQALFDLLRSLPAEFVLRFGGFEYAVETEPLLAAARESLASLAVDVARAAPVLTLKLLLFVFLVYALLYRPSRVEAAAVALVPESHHGILFALHERVRATLLSIYVLQVATAAGTFVIALVVFAALGYDAPFTLAVVAAILQFVPVLGPSVLVIVLVAVDVLAGNLVRAALGLVLGLAIVGFIPDAIIRPRLAKLTSDLPVSLYFVGFVGGVLTVGAVGFIAGPLVVALLVEVATLLSRETNARDPSRSDPVGRRESSAPPVDDSPRDSAARDTAPRDSAESS